MISRLLIAGLFAAITAAVVCAQTSTPSAQPPGDRNRAGQAGTPNAPEGFILIDENTIFLLANEPQAHFVQALGDMAQKDNQGAAQEIRIAAAFLDLQAIRADPGPKDKLIASARELKNYAEQLANQRIPTPQQLNQAFARANLALAEHFQAKAQNDLQKNRPVAAGHELQSAAIALRQSMTWSGQPMTRDTLQSIASAQQNADQWIKPPATPSGPSTPPALTPQQVVQALGQQIQQADSQLQGTAIER